MAETASTRDAELNAGSAFERWRERNLPVLMLAPAVVILAGLVRADKDFEGEIDEEVGIRINRGKVYLFDAKSRQRIDF